MITVHLGIGRRCREHDPCNGIRLYISKANGKRRRGGDETVVPGKNPRADKEFSLTLPTGREFLS
jgi:hypothetical protein